MAVPVLEMDVTGLRKKMAAVILFTVTLCFILFSVIGLYAARKQNQVPSLANSHDSGLTEKTLELDIESDLDSASNIGLLLKSERASSLDAVVDPSFNMDSVKRTRARRHKRSVIVSHGCPKGLVRFANWCMTFEKYMKLNLPDDEEE